MERVTDGSDSVSQCLPSSIKADDWSSTSRPQTSRTGRRCFLGKAGRSLGRLLWSNRQVDLGAVDRLLDEKKRQTTIRVLLRSASSQPITTSSSRSFRRNQVRSTVAETQCRQLMDGVHFSRRINLEFSIDCRRRSHCRRKRKQAGKTNVLLCSKQSIVYTFLPSIIHLEKESLVCCHTCSSERKCTMRSIGFGPKLAHDKRDLVPQEDT